MVIGTGTLSGLADNSPWTTVTATWVAQPANAGQAIQLQVVATNFLEGSQQWQVPTFGVTYAALTGTTPPLASPTLTTTASAAVTLGTTAPTISDSAVLAGGSSPTGNVSFTLKLGSTTVYTTSDTVSGNATYTAGYTLPTTGTVTGTYAWTDSYSGDSDNNAATGNTDTSEQTVVGAASPTLTTTASPASVTLGTTAPTISDSAVLAGGYYETGSVSFTLKLGSTTVYTTSDTVSGNGTYTASYTLPTTGTVTGTYAWTDSYGGDRTTTRPTATPAPASRRS